MKQRLEVDEVLAASGGELHRDEVIARDDRVRAGPPRSPPATAFDDSEPVL